MRKRHFAGALGAASLPALAHGRAAKDRRGPALLTVTGAIGKGNRGPFDPVRDQMMAKQKLSFDRAHAFDSTALAAMEPVTIHPTLEYDQRTHQPSGPEMVAKPVSERFGLCP